MADPIIRKGSKFSSSNMLWMTSYWFRPSAANKEAERDPKQRSDNVQAVHSRPPVTRCMNSVTPTAVTMKVMTATRLPGERVAQPLSPWPDVHAPARRSNRESTSNAGRSVAFQRGMIVGVGPSNLSIEGGSSTPDEVIGGVSDGLYLTDILGFGGNFATGDFSCGAVGMWIENGALSYPVAEITIARRMQEMLADVDAVGNDVSILDDMAAPTLRIAKMMVRGS